jgi:mitosis inhibitor protein kinase SWE1
LPQRDTSERGDDLDDEDMFFGDGPQDSSFVFSVTQGTPSPRSKSTGQAGLPKKYKPRDSGVMLLSDDEETGANVSGDLLSVMPAASISEGSIYSDAEDGLVTPGVGPGVVSGWPAVAVGGFDDIGENSFGGGDDGVNAFIMRTLAAGAKGQPDGPKKAPGTPVKKVKTTRLIVNRPWQSAVAAKVGLGFDVGGKVTGSGMPRKSLPAAFPTLGRKVGKVDLNVTDSEGEEEEEEDASPSWRKDKYFGVGLGRVSSSKENIPALPRTRWLMRRSSSGAFSSGSDASVVGTPTRLKGKGKPISDCLFYLHALTM